jgi:hypothetical protein
MPVIAGRYKRLEIPQRGDVVHSILIFIFNYRIHPSPNCSISINLKKIITMSQHLQKVAIVGVSQHYPACLSLFLAWVSLISF